MFKKTLLFSVAAAVYTFAAPVALDALISDALSRDAQLQAARHSLASMQSNKLSFDSLSPPTLELEGLRTTPDDMRDQNEWGVAVSQMFERPDLKENRRQMWQSRMERQKTQIELLTIQRKAKIKAAYYNAILKQRLYDTAMQHEQSAKALFETSKKKLFQGVVSQLETQRFENEHAKAQTELLALHCELEDAQRALAKESMSQADIEPIASLLPTAKALDANRLLERLPQLSTARVYEQGAKERLYAAKMERLSDSSGLTASLGYQKMFDQKSVSLRLSIPLGVYGGAQERAKAALREASEQQSLKEAATLDEKLWVSGNIEAANDVVHHMGEYEKFIKTAQNGYELSLKAYGAGYASALELLDAARTLLEAKKNALAALQRYFEHRSYIENFVEIGE